MLKPGQKRCHYHGSAEGSGAPIGNQNARRHGLYSRHFTPDEIELAAVVEIGIDDEIRLLKVAIDRALKAGANLSVLAEGVKALCAALKTRYALRGEAARGLDQALAAVLDELGNELSMTLS